MKKATINEELELAYPDSFRIMSPDELRQAYGVDYADMWGIRDEERHAIVTVIWRESSELLLKLFGAHSLVKQYEKKLRKTYRDNDYRCDGFFDGMLAGRKMDGLRFSYAHEGMRQIGEMLVFRRGACNYTLCYYTREDTAQVNEPMYAELLTSLSLP